MCHIQVCKIFLSVKVKIYEQKLELSPCKRFLDPERSEPDCWVVVPALGDQLAQLPQQLRAVPPRRHLGPRARHAHHLNKEKIVSNLVKIFVREARKIFQEHEKYLRYSEADLPGACPRSWGHWAHTGSRAAGSRHTEQSAEEEEVSDEIVQQIGDVTLSPVRVLLVISHSTRPNAYMSAALKDSILDLLSVSSST